MDIKESSFNKKRLVVIDDYFPNLLTSFRIAEFNYYLENIEDSIVYSTTPYYKEWKNEYSKVFPQYEKKVKSLSDFEISQNMLIYSVFLGNIYGALPIIEAYRTPFIFTLYPGPGFYINDNNTNSMLKAICSSKFLNKVIVTQKITYDYLVNNFLPKEKVEFIYGGVLNSEYYSKNLKEKKYYSKNKKSFDICFVANKYMEKGIDKGYDVFIEVCKKLANKKDDINFHVVGGFSNIDIDVKDIGNRIKFYGTQHIDFFSKFYSNMDIILSPNISFKLLPGSFDGFPTGCCVEAAMNGVAVFCTDDLKNNISFSNDEMCIINRDVDDIVEKILYYYKNIDELINISKNGQKKVYNIFSLENQMKQRMKILSCALNN